MPEDVTDIVPINPPVVPKSIELWKAMNMQCAASVIFSTGPDENELVKQTDGAHPSEIKRMKEANQAMTHTH